MTKTASPEPAPADSGASSGPNGHLDEQHSTTSLSSLDSDLSENPLGETPVQIDSVASPTDGPHPNGDEPPPKRRRVRDTTPKASPRQPKPISPPWKKVMADGPSSFTEGGRRKSGRINTVPIELQQGDKRITRRALHSLHDSPPRNRHALTNGHGTSTSTPTAPSGASKRPTSSSSSKRPVPSKPLPRQHATSGPPKPTRKPSTGAAASQKKTPSTPSKPPAVGTRRSTRHARESDGVDATTPAGTRTTPRIKLRTRTPLTTIPLVHREQAHVRPKVAPTLDEYFQRAVDIPVEEGGLLSSEDPPRYTDEAARAEAQLMLRVEKEAEPGGLLSAERCSAFVPEPEEEPPRQWAHMDHLVKAMANFRKLLSIEHQRHRAMAKKLALACEAEWKRRHPQPKTAEEIEREERAKAELRWRHVTRAVAGTWDNVRAEINRRRLAEWEAQEQRRVKAALNEAVSLSEQKLQARQGRLDTEDLTDDTGDGEMTDSGDLDSGDEDDEEPDSAMSVDSEEEPDEDEDNMSSSDDDEDDDDGDTNSAVSDEGLTQEQLRAKYANLPALEADGAAEDGEAAARRGGVPAADVSERDPEDTSDESIDMDDDLGSSDDDTDSDGTGSGSEGDGEASDGDDEPGGLLGLFFGKTELKKIQEEAAAQSLEPNGVPDSDAMDLDPPPSTAKAAAETSDGPHQEQPEQPDKEETATPSVPPDAAAGDEEVKEEAAGETGTQVPVSPVDESSAPAEPRPPLSPDNAPPGSEAKLAAAANSEGVVPNGTSPTEDPLPNQAQGDDAADVPMRDDTDAPQKIPEVEVTEPPPADGTQRASPDTDAITNLPTPSRSQSPRTSDTKPSDVDTATSLELLPANHRPDSRSISPQPGASTPKTEIPFLLRGTLREYQHYGLDWLAGLYANNTNGILADEMGLGKTIQTIALLAHLACHHEVWGPHLVIVPTSVILNWEMEFKKWCPGFKILTYYGNQDERKRKRHGWTNDDVWNVCITSYQIVLQDQQVFRRRRWHYMILDEAHNIKNFKSQRWQTLLGFNTRARLLLTGTPLQNNLTELWSLLFFLMPPENGEGGFADLQEFHDWFHKPESQILESGREQMDDEARAIIAKLHKVLRPYLLRRLKADVEKQMPAKYEHVEFCRLSKRQRELYDGFLSRADTRETLSSGNYLSIINCLMQLRKVCNHPDLFVDRPIMTSFRMPRSVPADFETREQVVRRWLADPPMSVASLRFLNMVPTQHENLSTLHTDRIAQLSSHRILLDLRDAQKARAQYAYAPLDPATVKSNLVYLESAARWERFEELQHCVYLNALRRQQRPIYGKRLVEMLTLNTETRPFKQRPKVPQKIMSWFEEDSFLLRNAVRTLPQRAAAMEMTITKFACVTPAVVTRDLDRFLLGPQGMQDFEELNLRLSQPVKYAPYLPKEAPADPWHEARMRLSIQFPDKRLLQYDCGKLQVLDKLLRRLQAGGHRALIFTQMTKVLDILEQFLNIHGHKYLRLDGATKVEQRQILTDRFNHDPRILCFILSTRSGGLGINLTGADTVIFYDQDWNPAMDKQCQDRCHRIGQTRDVHIYRLVSEHTIEANILRKASQKQMLDDVVIQEGEFTTDYLHKLSVRDVVDSNGEVRANEADVAANAAMDRVLGGAATGGGGSGGGGGIDRNVGRVLEQAEDTEDVAAARVAEKEIQQDDADFLEQRPTPGAAGGGGGGASSGVSSALPGTPRDGLEVGPSAVEAGGGEGAATAVEYDAEGRRMGNVDDYMLKFMAAALEGTPLDLPKDKKKSKKKKGKDTRKR